MDVPGVPCPHGGGPGTGTWTWQRAAAVQPGFAPGLPTLLLAARPPPPSLPAGACPPPCISSGAGLLACPLLQVPRGPPIAARRRGSRCSYRLWARSLFCKKPLARVVNKVNLLTVISPVYPDWCVSLSTSLPACGSPGCRWCAPSPLPRGTGATRTSPAQGRPQPACWVTIGQA